MQLPSICADDAYYLNLIDNAVEASVYDPAILIKHSNDPVSGRVNVKPHSCHFAHLAIHTNAPSFSH